MQPAEDNTTGCETAARGRRLANTASLQPRGRFYNARMAKHRSDSGIDAAAALRREIAQLAHELRRVSEGLERNSSHALEERARHLRDNIALCERELARELTRARTPGE